MITVWMNLMDGHEGARKIAELMLRRGQGNESLDLMG